MIQDQSKNLEKLLLALWMRLQERGKSGEEQRSPVVWYEGQNRIWMGASKLIRKPDEELGRILV